MSSKAIFLGLALSLGGPTVAVATITESTSVQITMAIASVGGAVALTWRISRWVNRIETRLEQQARWIKRIETKVDRSN